MEYAAPYNPPTLVVDAVLFQLVDNVLNVLLIRRASEPFKSSWALPGGYCPAGETTLDALLRVTKQKAGVDIVCDMAYVEQLYTFDTVARDPRGHAVSVTYMACGKNIERQNNTADEVRFFPIDHLPKTAYDHSEIIAYAHDRLQSKISYTNAIYAMLPELFTLSSLQSAYEAILMKKLDKRNFRKKFLQLNLIDGTKRMQKDGAHRPAQLFTFNKQYLHTLARSFE